jgi:hypothetical protein
MSSQYHKKAAKEVEDAAFAMKKELEEAEAVVEECYRRRVRRARLEGVLPVGRPMSEGELDTLSELLGDEVGGRAKRRGEIEEMMLEEMMLEEMEAELGEVKAEIRKRRRAGAGWLPLTLALLMCLAGSSVEGFTAYDCSNRSNVVEAYLLLEPDACANMGKEGEVETMVYGEIVQIKQDRMIPVLRCIVIETVISHTAACFRRPGSLGMLDSGSSSHWKPGSAARQGEAGR